MCDSICLLLGHRREMEWSGPGPVNRGRGRRDARHPRTRGTAAAMEASSKSAWSSLGRAVYLLLSRESTSDRKQVFGEAMGRRGWFRRQWRVVGARLLDRGVCNADVASCRRRLRHFHMLKGPRRLEVLCQAMHKLCAAYRTRSYVWQDSC
jgi:hypothetical protein